MRSLIILIAILLSQTAFALETKPYLTLEMAKIMADTCEAKASAEGWRKVNVAIFDDGGNLKLFRRQDGAFMHSIKIAQLKGRTSAGMPRSTRALGEFNFAKAGATLRHRAGAGTRDVSGWAADSDCRRHADRWHRCQRCNRRPRRSLCPSCARCDCRNVEIRGLGKGLLTLRVMKKSSGGIIRHQ